VVATSAGKIVAVEAAAFDSLEAGPPLLGAGPLTAAAAAAGSSLGSSRSSALAAAAAAGRGPLAGELLVDTACQDAVDIAAHPTRPEVYVLAASGALQRWDTAARRMLLARPLPAECRRRPRALAVARDGAFVAVGGEGGHVVVVDADGLEELAVMQNSGQPIERCVRCRTAAMRVLPHPGGSCAWLGLCVQRT
jgi:hypothetical protein